MKRKKLRVILTVACGRPGRRDFASVSVNRVTVPDHLADTLAALSPGVLRDLVRLSEGVGK
jgi:hypothetical protein